MTRFRYLACCLTFLTAGGGLIHGCKKTDQAPRSEMAEAESSEPPWFTAFGKECGIDFVHDAGEVPGEYFMPQVVGSGVALFDFNNDGLLDVYLLQNAGPKSQSKNRLYQQLPGGRFKDVSAGSGLDVAGFGMGVAVGDFNNDGYLDVLVTEYGGVRLFLNNGNGTFTDVTKEAGLSEPGWSTSACFFDYDRDGWLDLLIVKYVDYDPSWKCSTTNSIRDYCSPKPFQGTVSRLYRNLGLKDGTSRVPKFKDVSVESGIGTLPGPGLGVVCADFDGDCWPDVFIANDGKPNHLWINQKNGTFKEEAVPRGVAFNAMGLAEANMGIGWGDVDGDGLYDVFVTHLNHETNTLWKQGPRGQFKDVTTFSGMHQPRWKATGFGTMLGDFDHDGALDAVLTNGRVAKVPVDSKSPLGPFWGQYGDRNQVFANEGNGRFRDVSPSNPAMCGTPNIGRGLAVGDLNNDGALDVVITSVAGPVQVYRNVAPKRGHWLMVRAIDPALRRDAYGAELTVAAGEKRYHRTINPGGTFLCHNDVRAHFGLGKADRVDAIHVLWPDGKKETFAGCSADQQMVLRKGEGKPED